MYWAGFDLGGTKMLVRVFDGDFKSVGRAKRKTKAETGQQGGIERMVEAVDMALDDAGLARGDLCGIGVGAPGPLNPETGVVFDLPNIGWRDVALGEALRKALGCPAVVANDVDAGLFGEYRFGAAKGARCAVGVFPGTGIGGGCVYEGDIVLGAKMTCFEIGHMQMMPDGPLCGCGKRGCLEAIASRLAISSACAAAAYRGEAPYLRENAGTDLSNIRSGALRDAIKAGDTVVEEIVRNAARWLGTGIGNAINLMAPDVVVLGGGLVEAMPKLFTAEVKKTAESAAMPAFRGRYKVSVAALGDDATVMGAAAWARRVVSGE